MDKQIEIGTEAYRVWPDGTVQLVEDGEAYTWMSDDFALVYALSESDALNQATEAGSRK